MAICVPGTVNCSCTLRRTRRSGKITLYDGIWQRGLNYLLLKCIVSKPHKQTRPLPGKNTFILMQKGVFENIDLFLIRDLIDFVLFI